MTEETKRKLNPTETINKFIPSIIEAFVTFYGESERENITKKFQNMLVIGYSDSSHMKTIIIKSNQEKSKEIINEYLDKLTTSLEEKEKLNNLLFKGYDLSTPILQPINQYLSYKNGSSNSSWGKEQVVNFLKQIKPETTIENLDNLISSGAFKSIDILIPLYEQCLTKYQEYEKEMKPYNDYSNQCDQLYSTLTKKYSKKLIEELKDLFTEDEFKQIIDSFNSPFSYSIKNINGKTENYMGYSLNGTRIIDAFSSENDRLLQEGKTWQQDSIKKDRIQYFKNLGLDLGDDYETYLSNPDALNLTPSKELVERVINTSKQIYNEMMNEYYTSLPEYQRNRARIDELGLLDKEDGYNANAYENERTSITTNLKLVDGSYVEYPILLMYMVALEEYYDSSMIHELNHVYELSIQSVKDNDYVMTCGWDIVGGQINNQKEEQVSLEKRETKRNYELFNEIINELISQEISEIMSQSDIYIFNNKENKKIAGGTSYEHSMFLVETFYETYKQEIIESRKNGNVSILFDKVGKDNFESLNNLFHEFYDAFSEVKFYKLHDDLQKGIETERTQKLKELITKRNNILARMEEYSHKKTPSI